MYKTVSSNEAEQNYLMSFVTYDTEKQWNKPLPLWDNSTAVIFSNKHLKMCGLSKNWKVLKGEIDKITILGEVLNILILITDEIDINSIYMYVCDHFTCTHMIWTLFSKPDPVNM